MVRAESAHAWWFWPPTLFFFCFVLGIIAVLAGVGGGDYMHTTESPHGWGWLRLLDTGDYLNFIGLTILALITILCYLVLLPGYIRQKDWIYTLICVLEVLVLSLAASGILGAGGH